MTHGERIVQEARALVGVPFRHQGRSEFGLDCIGLMLLVAQRAVGWHPPPGTRPTYRRRALGSLEEQLREHCAQTSAPAAGVIALMRFQGETHAGHVAILTPDTMVHALATEARVVETIYGEPWPRRTVGLFLFPGLSA